MADLRQGWLRGDAGSRRPNQLLTRRIYQTHAPEVRSRRPEGPRSTPGRQAKKEWAEAR